MFIRSVWVLLLITAAAKLFSAGGTALVLGRPDPLLLLSARHTLILAALTEVAVLSYLVWGEKRQTQYLLICWLSALFVTYRVFVHFIAPGGVCQCLGTVAQRLPLKPEIVDLILRILVGYMFIGSICLLLRGRRVFASTGLRR